MTASVPFWDDGFATWDKVRLGDTTLPGVCSVSGAVKRDVEVKKAKGKDKASIKDNGYDPARLAIEWRIYTQEQWIAAQAFLPQIHPRASGGERRPVAIGHPAPNFVGVQTIYVTEVGFPELTGEKEISIRISAIEWEEEPKTVKQGAGVSGGKSGWGNYDDSVADEEAALQDAINQEEERLAWAIEQERQQQEEAWPFGSGGAEVPPFTGDEVSDEFTDNANDGLDAEDEFLETT